MILLEQFFVTIQYKNINFMKYKNVTFDHMSIKTILWDYPLQDA